MRSLKRATNQYNLLGSSLDELLNPKHELYLLANAIDWDYFDREFAIFYSDYGHPAHSIRLMVSLLILKSIYNLSDEKLIEEHWEMNAYFQYFSGKEHQHWGQPCAASDIVYFRKRIGESGVEKIFKYSIDLHHKQGQDPNVSIDSTVQEKKITYPTDSKLQKKIIYKCVKIAKQEGLKLRRSYRRTSKQLVRDTYNGTHPKRRKKVRVAKKKLKTIAGSLIRELDRKLPVDCPERTSLDIFRKVLNQTTKSKNKKYSLHEPEVYCIAKGKANKKYEYGCKASVVLKQKTGIIVGAVTFKTNVYDGHTLEDVLIQTKILTGKSPINVWVERGYKGKQLVGETIINMPKPPLKRDTEYQKRKKRKHFRKRAAIEPIIGHLKQDYRAAKNYLKGQTGDSINFMTAAAGFNFRKLIKKLKTSIVCIILKLKIESSIQKLFNSFINVA